MEHYAKQKVCGNTDKTKPHDDTSEPELPTKSTPTKQYTKCKDCSQKSRHPPVIFVSGTLQGIHLKSQIQSLLLDFFLSHELTWNKVSTYYFKVLKV